MTRVPPGASLRVGRAGGPRSASAGIALADRPLRRDAMRGMHEHGRASLLDAQEVGVRPDRGDVDDLDGGVIGDESREELFDSGRNVARPSP